MVYGNFWQFHIFSEQKSLHNQHQNECVISINKDVLIFNHMLCFCSFWFMFTTDNLNLLFLEIRQKFSSQKFCRNCRRLFRWIDIWTKACELIELKMNWSVSSFFTEMNRFIWKYQLARCGISFLFLQSRHPYLQPVKEIQLVSKKRTSWPEKYN